MGLLDHLIGGKAIHKWLNHRNLYLLGLATIICGLGWSNVLMSVGQLIVLGNWIIELAFKKKVNLFKSNKLLWILLSLFFLHLLGLLWTEDFKYGFKDITVKLPLLCLPLVIGTSEKLNLKEWKALLIIYFTTLLLLTIASFSKYLGLFGYDIIDKRELSIYISHIRYGLNLCLAIILIFFFNRKFGIASRLFLISIALWFLACLVLFSLYSGLAILFIVAAFVILHYLNKQFKSTHSKEISFIAILALFIVSALYINSIRKDYNTQPELNYDQHDAGDFYTEGGEKYWSEFKDKRQENGIYVRRFIAWEEIEREWNKRSEIDFWHTDLRGQTLDQTLNRYLASKGLKKDSVGISKLNDDEIRAIEKGIANQYFLNHNNLQNRIYQTLFELDEYNRTGIANGFSLALRFQYWKTGLSIIKENFVLGVGTGDIKTAFQQQYEKDNSLLDEKYRKRAHNQFLTFFITFGVFGLLVFILSLVFPAMQLKANRVAYFSFLGIICISFLTEDTLETQAGVTLFAFFNSLFLVGLAKFQDKIAL